MPVTQVQSGQERVVAAFVKLGGTDKLRSEVLCEGPPRVEPLTFPPMKAKDIKMVRGLIAKYSDDGRWIEGGKDVAIQDMEKDLGISRPQAAEWVETVMGGVK